MLKLMLKLMRTNNLTSPVLHSAQDQLDMDRCVKYSYDEDLRDI